MRYDVIIVGAGSAGSALADPNYSLKVVETRAGFERSMDEYGGDWSIA